MKNFYAIALTLSLVVSPLAAFADPPPAQKITLKCYAVKTGITGRSMKSVLGERVKSELTKLGFTEVEVKVQSIKTEKPIATKEVTGDQYFVGASLGGGAEAGYTFNSGQVADTDLGTYDYTCPIKVTSGKVKWSGKFTSNGQTTEYKNKYVNITGLTMPGVFLP